MKEQIVYINTDGACRGNPGKSSIGIVIRGIDKNILDQHKEYIGIQTNNFAEYTAGIRGLELGSKYTNEKAILISDSELMIKQLNGQYKVKNPNLKPLFEKLNKVANNDFKEVLFVHTRRENNGDADALANEALDEL